MKNYSIRRLHLINQTAIAKELGVKNSPKLGEFVSLYQQNPCVLKVISKGTEISGALLSAFSLRRIPCWIHGKHTAYLFSNEQELRDWTRLQQYASSEEEIFVEELRGFLVRQSRLQFEMSSERYMFNFGGPTRLMGILNTTPDSFFDGGKYSDTNRAVERGIEMESEGADIIDIGGESTRPGAEPLSEGDELERVIPVIERLTNEVEIPLSIDTYKAQVAEAAIQAGATIVNDVSGMKMDPQMMEVVAHYGVPVVIMHMKGQPRNMQENPVYSNLIDELYLFFEERIMTARKRGISVSKMIIDPGIGFGKRIWDNYEILQRLQEFRGLGCPILVGPSRKSFIGKVLNLPPEERLEGTAAAVTAAVAANCQIVRVHDIQEMFRVVQIADLIFGHLEYQQEQSGP